MDELTLITTLAVCLFGSGGIVLWLLNRLAKRSDDRHLYGKDLKEIKTTITRIQMGLVMALENDKVIFKSLRTHEINGESEEQEKKMEVFSNPLRERATAVIVAHNHPSGILIPSNDDINVTQRLLKAGELLGIRVLHHLIFSDEGFRSMLEENELT